MTIRRAVGADRAALAELVRAFYAEDGHPYEEARVLRALLPLLADDAVGQVWLLCEDGAALGYAVLTWGWSLESGGREGLLDEIFVARRGEGLGGRLLEHAIAAAAAAGCRVLFLETERANESARRFYARHGLELQDSVWMSRQLV